MTEEQAAAKQRQLQALENYEEVSIQDLGTFNLLHLYNTGEDCYPDGFYDAQWFNVVVYNTWSMKKATGLRPHDAITLYRKRQLDIRSLRFFVDGSVLITLSDLASTKSLDFQAIEFVPPEEENA